MKLLKLTQRKKIRTKKFSVGDPVIITGPSMSGGNDCVGLIGVIDNIDPIIGMKYYGVEINRHGLRWFVKTSIAFELTAESLEKEYSIS